MTGERRGPVRLLWLEKPENMKSMNFAKLVVSVSSFALLAPVALAEEPAPKCEMCEKMKKPAPAPTASQSVKAAELKLRAAELDKLVTEMNETTGKDKIEAMAAVLTRLAGHYRELNDSIALPLKPETGSEETTQSGHQHGKAATPPAESAEGAHQH